MKTIIKIVFTIAIEIALVMIYSCYPIKNAISVKKSQGYYMTSYVLDINDNHPTYQYDSCSALLEHPVLLRVGHFVIKYRNHVYYFKIADLTEYSNNGHRWLRGTADMFGQPYSLKQTFFSNGRMTLWILPLKFHSASKINRKRAFVISNEEKTIKSFPLCKK